MAKRVISRITDSVKRSAFAESFGLVATTDAGAAGVVLGSIEPTINLMIAGDDLHVLARLGERDRVDKLSCVAIGLPGVPQLDPILARVVGSECRLRGAELLHQLSQI